MPIELAGISLPRIHRVTTREQADFVSHRIPGLEGNVVQDMGRQSVRLKIEGIFYGATAKDDLEALRDVYKSREPVDFLADLVGQAYFAQVIVEEMEVRQAADEPEQFSYQLTITEYVPPPQPASGFETPDIDSLLELEALDFLDMIQLPDLLSVPGFGDPTVPLQSILDGVSGTLEGLNQPAEDLAGLYGGSGSQSKAVSLTAWTVESKSADSISSQRKAVSLTARTVESKSADSISSQHKAVSMPVSASGSLFETLEGSIDENQILQLIQSQLNKLLSAGQEAGNAQQQSSGGIGALQGAVAGLIPPDINRSGLLEQGFSTVQQLLPAQATDILGDLPNGIDTLFATLQTNLVEQLSGILGNFGALSALGIGVNAPVVQPETDRHSVPTEDSPAFRGMSRRAAARNVGPIVDPLNALLDLLPNPLDARALLELLSGQLNQLPRERIPVQNLPILDELRDKLATVLGWLDQDSAGLSASLANSTQRLSEYIRSGIYDNTITPVKNRLETLADAVDLATVKADMDAIIAGLSSLATQVQSADLSAADATIETVSARIGSLQTAGSAVLANWVNGDGQLAVQELSALEDRLEERMADVLLLTAPATDLAVIGLLLDPLNKALDPSGINAFIRGIQNLFDAIDNLINQLNLTQISSAIEHIVNEGVQAVQTLQNLLVNVTVEFSLLVNQIEQAINSLGIDQLVNELRGVLEQFEQTVVQGLNDLFEPVRQVLLTAFDTINNFVAGFDPKEILQSVLDLIQALTNVLSDPVLLDTIGRLKSILGDVNDELGSFSFRSVTDVIIDGIGVVEDAFDIVAKIPMTDSIREEVSKALNAIPATIRPATDAINAGLEEIVENGAKPVLVAIKDKPAELVTVVEQYSPDKYLGDQLSAPYQAFVGELEQLKPTTLVEPVTVELNKVLDDVRETADPDQVFGLLQGPFDALYAALDNLNPAALIQPLQEKLTEGIHLVTDNLPLDAADAVFNQVSSITATIQKAIDDAHQVRDAMTAVNDRLAGLSNAEDQVNQLGDEVVAKLNSVSDFSPISAALTAVEQAIDDLEATPLQQLLFPAIDDQIAKITALDPQNRLISLVQAQRGFPVAQLNALPDSPQKTDLLDLIAGFDPLHNDFALPLGGLQDRLDDLQEAHARLLAFFSTWQNRYHQANGPLGRFRQKNLTLPQLKTMLADTVRTQLSGTLAPGFQIIEKFQSLLSTLLTEIIDLIQRLEVQAASLVAIGTALETVRQGIDDLVALLEGLDITFIATEIEDIFDAVKAQLDAINPQNISNLLKTTFDHLLDALAPNTLLGLSDLDDRHKTLIDLLKARDPKVLLTDTVQPEYDKILVFLNELNISDLLNTFLQRIEDLKAQLTTELGRTADAYENMVRTIPGDLQGELGVSVSVST